MSGLVIRGVEFDRVWCAAGARNFRGEGWPFHRIAKRLFGLDLSETTLVSKTMTLRGRAGNMPLKRDRVTPKYPLPACIWIGEWWNLWKGFRHGDMFNSVGWSGPPAGWLIFSDEFLAGNKPFVISFMSDRDTIDGRLEDLALFCRLLEVCRLCHLSTFGIKTLPRFGIELSYSCPNIGIKFGDDLDEIKCGCELVHNILGCPCGIKLSLPTPPEAMIAAASVPHCHWLDITNTLPWHSLPGEVDWSAVHAGDNSPLYERNSKFGQGGLSGKRLFEPLCRRVRELRRLGYEGALVAGGGIWHAQHVDILRNCGADAISIGTVIPYRPWRVNGIIARAHEIDWDWRRLRA